MNERYLDGWWRGEMTAEEKIRARCVRKVFKEALRELDVPSKSNPGFEVVVRHFYSPRSNRGGSYYPQINYVQIELFNPDDILDEFWNVCRDKGVDAIRIVEAHAAAHEARHVWQKTRLGRFKKSYKNFLDEDAEIFAKNFVKSRVDQGKFRL